MNTKRELLMRLQQIISEQLGVQQEVITEKSSWTQLGADSLDRLEMSRVIEDAFDVEIPHHVGEWLNTIGETVDHLFTLLEVRKDISNIRIEPATTNQQWSEMLGVRAQVFTIEYGFTVTPLPGPGTTGIWHFLAFDNQEPIGTLSIVDTTGDRHTHQRYRLRFRENERVARYAQLAILKPYRKRGIFEKLIETARTTVVHPNGFAVEWLLYPAERALTSMLTWYFGFTAEAPLLTTEFGKCHVLVRRQPDLSQVVQPEEFVPVVETCPI